jgi:hypothetical protein
LERTLSGHCLQADAGKKLQDRVEHWFLRHFRGCDMETAIGEIPKYRSAFRRQVKKMATFNMTR